jgi:hypothetical protein
MKKQEPMTKRPISEDRSRAVAPANDPAQIAEIFQALLVTRISGTPQWLAESMHQQQLKRQ